MVKVWYMQKRRKDGTVKHISLVVRVSWLLRKLKPFKTTLFGNEFGITELAQWEWDILKY